MPANLNINQPEISMIEQKPRSFSLKLGHVIYAALLVMAVYALYQIFFMVRLTAGMTAEKPVAKYYATVEIVNASGIAQISKPAAEYLKEHKSPDLEIVITDVGRLEYRIIEKTLVISREEDTELAERIAAAFGLDDAEVVYRPPIEKDMSPNVTLVLGADVKHVLNSEKTNRES
jgi:hypothetical protein